MMSLASSVFIFYLCICSLHASNARRLGLTDNGGFGKQLFPSKVIDEVKVVNMDSTKKGAEFGDSIDYKSHGGEKPKAMKFIAEEEAISGSITIKPIVSVSNSNWHVSHNNNGHLVRTNMFLGFTLISTDQGHAHGLLATDVFVSGKKIEESSSHMGLPKAIGVEDPTWQSSGRVILEHDPHGIQQEEETHSSYHNSVNEVVQEADYESPRMNIPTHN